MLTMLLLLLELLQNRVPRATKLDELKMETVIRSYMSRGHLAALIDPLYIIRKPMFRPEFPSRTVLREHRVPVDRDTLYLLPNDTSLGLITSKILIYKECLFYQCA